jgi:hypothetical protein
MKDEGRMDCGVSDIPTTSGCTYCKQSGHWPNPDCECACHPKEIQVKVENETDEDWLREDLEKLLVDTRAILIMAKEIRGKEHSTVFYLKEAIDALRNAQ